MSSHVWLQYEMDEMIDRYMVYRRAITEIERRGKDLDNLYITEIERRGKDLDNLYIRMENHIQQIDQQINQQLFNLIPMHVNLVKIIISYY